MSVKALVAKKEDLGEICAFLMTSAPKMQGWSLQDIEISLEKVSEQVLNCFLNGQIFFIRNKLQKIEGCILLLEEEPWFSSTLFVVDKAFIVVDEPTTPNLAKTLLLASKAYAKIKGRKLFISIYTTNSKELKEKFFKINKFDIAGFMAIHS